MFLEKLELQGFKSFALKTTLRFNQGITCVVGPNGSGKSNLADAIRWVMGEQSLKTLRGKKSEDVIFAGSHTRARLGFAQVSLFLNNEDRKGPIDYSEVVITRRIYRNGESDYLLNKAKVRLQDILMFLAKANFGQRTYSVIGQGMIDSILAASPQERKNFFDEAAGVRQYQIKREQTVNRLLHTKENLKQSEILIQEIEPRLRSLTRQVGKLRRRKDVENNLRELQFEYYSRFWLDLSRNFNQEDKKLKAAAEEKKVAEKEVELIQKQIESLAGQETRQELFKNLQKEYDHLLAEKNLLTKEQMVLKGKKELSQRKGGNLNLVWLEKREDELKRKIGELEGELGSLGKDVQGRKELLKQKTKEQDGIIHEFEELENKLLVAKEKMKQETSPPLPEFREKLERIFTLQTEFIKSIDQVKDLSELEPLKKKAHLISKRVHELKEQISRSGATTDQAEKILELQKKITTFLKTKDSLVNEVNDLKLAIEVKEEKFKLLNDEKEKREKEKKELVKELSVFTSGQGQTETVYLQEEKDLKIKLDKLENQLKDIKEKLENFNQEEQKKKDELLTCQKKFRQEQNQLNEKTNSLNEIKVSLAKLAAQKDNLEKEMKQELPSDLMTQVHQGKNLKKSATPEQEIFNQIQKYKRQLDLIGGIDPAVEGEYEECRTRYDFLTTQGKDLRKAIVSLENIIKELDEKIKKQFNLSFAKINLEFDKYFKILFGGGRAKLILQKERKVQKELIQEELAGEEKEESDEDLEKEEKKISGQEIISGVEIQASPPGKKLKGINMLSGGEKAMTSIALICAIIANNPAPFVVLDEVDAALDEANSERFASIVDELAKKSQFILITHNRETMKRGRILYGVTMDKEGISKLLSIKMEEAERLRNTK